MPKQTILGCGVDPSSSGWYSSNTGSSKSWSSCVKPELMDLEGPLLKEMQISKMMGIDTCFVTGLEVIMITFNLKVMVIINYR